MVQFFGHRERKSLDATGENGPLAPTLFGESSYSCLRKTNQQPEKKKGIQTVTIRRHIAPHLPGRKAPAPAAKNCLGRTDRQWHLTATAAVTAPVPGPPHTLNRRKPTSAFYEARLCPSHHTTVKSKKKIQRKKERKKKGRTLLSLSYGDVNSGGTNGNRLIWCRQTPRESPCAN